MIECRAQRRSVDRAFEHDAPGQSACPERVYRFTDDDGQVAVRARDGELAAVDAGDVHQVADQPAHARGITCDPPGLRLSIAADLAGERRPRDHRRADDNPAKQVAQVVRDDCQEVVPGTHGSVGPAALGFQVAVGGRA